MYVCAFLGVCVRTHVLVCGADGGTCGLPQPNCYTRSVSVDGERHVVIIARRRVLAGEELTYDYLMPFEPVKIVCRCGAPTCRRYMN
jgi:SET domain-containing protein